jgi:hypothetical protein
MLVGTQEAILASNCLIAMAIFSMWFLERSVVAGGPEPGEMEDRSYAIAWRAGPQNKSEKCCIFFGGLFGVVYNHLLPAFHHKFTIKKPHTNDTFLQNPL